jgi:hypothetical protein
MNFSSSLHQVRMGRHARSLRLVCIVPCTNASTRETPKIFKIPLWRNLFGGMLSKLFHLERDSTISRPPAPKPTTRRKVSRPPSSPVKASPSAPVAPEARESISERIEVNNSFLSAMSLLFEAEAELYFWDTEVQEFRNDGIINAQLFKQTNANYVYWLTASNDKGILLTHRIHSSMNQRFSPKMLSLTWNHLGDDNSQSSWLFRFHSEENFQNALKTFTQCLWESLHQTPWGKIKVRSMVWSI